ncbi:MAG: TonB-dependent receptor domain-containing protein [Rhodanobacteraceae bacterium]
MLLQNVLSQGIRNALAAVAITACAVAVPALAANAPVGPAPQQQADQSGTSTQSPQTLSAVIVTGSHIPLSQLVTSQPVLKISHQEIENSGVKSVGEFLDNMTSVGFVQGAASGAFYANGTEQVDLRYLGSNRLLVLLNGKRMPSSFGGSVDLNQIPISIVDRIEVLQDGASAVYGADAIAGVINIITKKTFKGAQLTAYYGINNGPKSDKWDGQTENVDLTLGRSGKKGHILMDVSYRKVNAIPALNREFSTSPAAFGHSRGGVATPEGTFFFWAPTDGDPTQPGNSPAAYTGLTSAQCPDSQTTDAAGNTVYIPYCSLAKTPLTSGTSGADFHPFSDKDRNIAGSQSIPITVNQKIKNVYVEGSYDITPSITFDMSALYNDRQTDRPLDADLMFFTRTGLDIGPNANGNPFGFRLVNGSPVQVGTTPSGAPVVLDAGTLQAIYRTTDEAGIRVGFDDATSERFEAGFKGQFATGSISWLWNADYIYASNKVKLGETNLDSNLGMSLATDPNCSTIPGCVPLNLFGGQGVDGTGTWTPDMVGYTMRKVAVTALDHKDVRVLDAGITTGNLFSLPAGGVGFAFGVQRRNISGASIPPGLYVPNRREATVPEPLSGAYDIKSAYAEFNVPLLANLPFVKYLSADIASRYEDYSTFGSTVKSRIGLLYQPVKDVAIRAGYAEGFRAADLSELFSPPSISYPYVTDPCSNYGAAGTPAAQVSNCKAAGVPASYTQGTGQVTGIYSGNVNLLPETSKSKTLGVVYSPSWFPGFNASLDYYHIALTQEIASFNPQQILDYCYKQGLPQFCSLIQRNSSGLISQLHVTSANIGETRTAGFDLDASYRFPETSFGNFKLRLNLTKVNYFDEYNPKPDGTVSVTRVVGDLDYGTIPRVKGYAALDYSFHRFSAAFIGHYFSGFTGTCSDAKNGQPISLANLGFCTDPNKTNNALSTNHRNALSWFDLHLSYNSPWNTTFTFGVNNIFGQTPQGNQDGYGNVAALDYGVYSRLVYAQIRTKF